MNSERRKRKTMDYLATLTRLPDDIVLAVMGRDLDLGYPYECVCGWAVRESIARELGIAASDVASGIQLPNLIVVECANRFGGSVDEWDRIFIGVCNDQMPLIEEAMARRLDLACR